MGISSLGVGSSILTQDVLDQLRAADDAKFVTPVELEIANEGDKKDAFGLIDANMTNVVDSLAEMTSQTLYNERTTEVTGTSVEVTADANTDLQDFTLDVVNLATKQIEQSGAFTASTDTIATAAGSVNLNIDGQDFTIDYDETTTLDDFKKAINDVAGDKVDATIVQISSGEFRLFVSSVDTGTTQDITMTDTTGNLTDTRLTTDVTAIQSGVDANFTFNGQAITRTSNDVDDLIIGLDITLKEVGLSTVKVEQNRDAIFEKIDSFIEHYNAAVAELDRMTKVSTESEERGIFSSDSTIRALERMLGDMYSTVDGGVAGNMSDYGFDVDEDGKLSIDKDILNTKMDEDSGNVEAFFSGGDFTQADGTVVTIDGAFTGFTAKVEGYTGYNNTLDQFEDSINERISTLEDRKTTAIERLDARYEILAKQYAAYDLIIAQLDSASAMFTEMTTTTDGN